MTPMIDIVFLLIIFFLVSSHLSRQENRHPVRLSEASGGGMSDPQATPLTLTIDESSQLYWAATVISVTEIRPRMTAWLDARDRSSAAESPAVRLRIDRTVPYRDVEAVLQELAAVSVNNVAIVVNPESGGSP